VVVGSHERERVQVDVALNLAKAIHHRSPPPITDSNACDVVHCPCTRGGRSTSRCATSAKLMTLSSCLS